MFTIVVSVSGNFLDVTVAVASVPFFVTFAYKMCGKLYGHCEINLFTSHYEYNNARILMEVKAATLD